MTQPMCGFCKKKNTSLTADKREINNLVRPVMLVWCNNCGAVLGVLEYESTAQKLDQMTKQK
jgi:hypothetical protein